METIEERLSNILIGDSINDNEDLCDFTLKAQNEAAVAKGATPSAPSNFVPILRDTVAYIVMGVLFNEDGDVLLMQEAKSSCAGTWYLPAGRMEPGENIEEAVAREVVEETGLIMKPKSLIMVECASSAWFRFVLTGDIIGGKLKTPAQADSESLQAKWVKNIKELNLRGNDIHAIIERGRAYWKGEERQHNALLPALKTHSKLLLRLIICIRQKSSNKLHVLLSEKTEAHFPICEINHRSNLLSTLKKFMVDTFGADVPTCKPHGIMSLEHCAKSNSSVKDGMCITLLISFRVPMEELFPINKCSWFMVSKQLADLLLSKMPRNMTVPLNVIR